MKRMIGPVGKIVVAACAMALLPLAAEARKVAVDFPVGGEFADEGSVWAFPPGSDIFGPADLPASRSLLFSLDGFSSSALNVGGSLFSGYCVHENGGFSLSASGGACDVGVDPTFSLLPIGLISFETDNQQSADGAIFVSNGYSADRMVPGDPGSSPPYDLADAVPALRLTWWNLSTEGYDVDGTALGTRYSLQAFIYFLGNGDFDLDVRYNAEGGGYPGVTRSITAGGESLYSNSDPLISAGNYFYHFRNGVFSTGTDPEPPVDVSEPVSGTLLLFGLAALWVSRKRLIG